MKTQFVLWQAVAVGTWLGWGAPAASGAKGDFGPQRVITSTASGAWSVFATDLDGDGDADVISASVNDDKIAWYENTDGQGTFGPEHVISAAADQAMSVFAMDLDGDADADVLSASWGDNKIAWYENTNGLGSFGPQHVIAFSAMLAIWVSAADLDRDGDADVLSASYNDSKIAWYQNTNGLGTFGPQQVISGTANGPWVAYPTDLDGDGDVDVLSALNPSDKVVWYQNTNGLGAFSAEKLVSYNVLGASSVCAADLDGDGDRDVLSASSN
ncbi:MAG: VCBS repeat-containing protein, partial [Planctomycetes bacterium]|nr:VCBS repeat-containing protein [Planctomycetota bacterium]